MTKETNSQKTYTQKELDALQQQKTDFYNKAIPHLEKAVEYEELKMRLDKARFEAVMYRLKFAELTSPKVDTPKEEKKS
jgi:hypothetical protein